MTERRDFYVYQHFKEDTGELFYIGKGSRRRAWSRSSRNRRWRFIVAKHGFRVEIVRDSLFEDDAFAIEAALIRGAGVENLATYTSGGRGASGWRHSVEARAAIAKAHTGRIPSAESRARMSGTIRSRPDLLAMRAERFRGKNNPAHKAANRARHAERMRHYNASLDDETRLKINAPRRGRPLSAEHRAKVSDGLRGKKRGPLTAKMQKVLVEVRERRKRPVETACGLKFGSTAEAGRLLGVRQGNIVNNCAGRSKSAGGFVWRYSGE